MNLNHFHVLRVFFQFFSKKFFVIAAALCGLTAYTSTGWSDQGFENIFDGQTLKGWTYIGKPGGEYFVTNGVIDCPHRTMGNLVTDREYTNFIFQLEYKYEKEGNNGVAVRVPLSTNNLTYVGVEIQMLDDPAPIYSNIFPWQHNGSVYGIVPAKNGAGVVDEWNTEEITCVGRHYHIVLNGRTIVDTDLNAIHDADVIRAHPGFLRFSGRLGFLGHWSHFQFRNLRVKDLPSETPDDQPPEGFAALFNGKDMNGWDAENGKRENWQVDDGGLVCSGKDNRLLTLKNYRNFELLVDWKISSGTGGEIYLRGAPQVHICGTNSPGQFIPSHGSGGLANKVNSQYPLMFADHPIGEWNRFHIVVIGNSAHVFLNNELVVNNATLENHDAPGKAVLSCGPIGLQGDDGSLRFKNIYLRELP